MTSPERNALGVVAFEVLRRHLGGRATTEMVTDLVDAIERELSDPIDLTAPSASPLRELMKRAITPRSWGGGSSKAWGGSG